ncbi:hypothetical protein K438DRAFT_1938777 [Mycena galopus ATCC 62051]|nr:hypothetical protein K438DRAFT_1938777 [Mycena galopus ATCC 62051]
MTANSVKKPGHVWTNTTHGTSSESRRPARSMGVGKLRAVPAVFACGGFSSLPLASFSVVERHQHRRCQKQHQICASWTECYGLEQQENQETRHPKGCHGSWGRREFQGS